MSTTLAKLDAIARTRHCPDCPDARLAVRWNATLKRDEVYCPSCKRTDGFRRQRSVTELWLENPDSVPIGTANVLARKYRATIEAMTEGLPPDLAQLVREKYGV